MEQTKVKIAMKQPPDPSRTDLEALREALAGVIQEDAIDNWLRQPNEAFDGLSPIELMKCGESYRLWRMVYYLKSGIPS